MYKVTLTLPIYNTELYIGRALLSALNQTFDSIEFLLIDDRGTDTSRSVVEAIIATHPRGKDAKIITHSENRGLGVVRNTGMDNATGEYIFFMDSDDELPPHCIEILYRLANENKVDFVQGRHAHSLKEINKVDKYILIGPSKFAVAKSLYQQKIILAPFTCNKLYRLNFLRENNIHCPSIVRNVEDRLFTFQVFINATSCVLAEATTYIYYKDNTESMTNKEKNNAASVQTMSDYLKIIQFKYDALNNYIDQYFFTQAILENYLLSLRFADVVKHSKIISRKLKSKALKQLDKLLVVKISRIPRFKNKFQFVSIFFLSKLPSIKFKMAMIRLYDKIIREYYSYKLSACVKS